MKRLTKTFANLFVLIMLVLCAFSFTACEDIKTMEITVGVYSTTSEKIEDKTLTVKLYRHLAPNTVDAITSYAKENYYDGATFYINESYSDQIMIGDFKFTNKTLVQNVDANNLLKPSIKGEFTSAGVKGSDLKNSEGEIGLWRGFYNGNYKVSDDSRSSGRATWYMPTDDTAVAGYDDYFCIFAQFDLENDSDNIATWELIKNTVKTSDSEKYEEYAVFYTGEYAVDGELNNGLTYNCMLKADFDKKIEEDEDFSGSIFEAEDNQLSTYNKCYIKVPVYNKDKDAIYSSCIIKSIKVK